MRRARAGAPLRVDGAERHALAQPRTLRRRRLAAQVGRVPRRPLPRPWPVLGSLLELVEQGLHPHAQRRVTARNVVAGRHRHRLADQQETGRPRVRSSGRPAVRIRCGPQIAIGSSGGRSPAPGPRHPASGHARCTTCSPPPRGTARPPRPPPAASGPAGRPAAGAARSTGTCRMLDISPPTTGAAPHVVTGQEAHPAAALPGGEPDQQEVQEAYVGAGQQHRPGPGTCWSPSTRAAARAPEGHAGSRDDGGIGRAPRAGRSQPPGRADGRRPARRRHEGGRMGRCGRRSPRAASRAWPRRARSRRRKSRAAGRRPASVGVHGRPRGRCGDDEPSSGRNRSRSRRVPRPGLRCSRSRSRSRRSRMTEYAFARASSVGSTRMLR